MSGDRIVNRAYWDDRARAHADSTDYGFDRFVADPTHLSRVVRFDLPLLGDVDGLRGVHLQCHIGTDTLSLARLGASMIGVDFSPGSLEQARRLAAAAGPAVTYVHCDVYDAPAALGVTYDLVYTGLGALCWLPDIQRCAVTVAALLRPGGRLFLREAHPVLWALDYGRTDDLLVITEPYFEQAEPQAYEEPGSYVDTGAAFTHNRILVWNHGLGEIVTALLQAGMTMTGLVEHRSVPWQPLPGRMTQISAGEWQIRDRPERLPHTYTLQAVRNPHVRDRAADDPGPLDHSRPRSRANPRTPTGIRRAALTTSGRFRRPVQALSGHPTAAARWAQLAQPPDPGRVSVQYPG